MGEMGAAITKITRSVLCHLNKYFPPVAYDIMFYSKSEAFSFSRKLKPLISKKELYDIGNILLQKCTRIRPLRGLTKPFQICQEIRHRSLEGTFSTTKLSFSVLLPPT